MKGPLDLLDLPLVFSQAHLLTPREFLNAAKKRGLKVQEGQLEALHRAGALTPLYRVRRDLRGIRARARKEGWLPEDALVQEHADAEWLISHRKIGLLHDPSEEVFRAWATYRRKSDVHDYSTSHFLYSPYQLLDARRLRQLIRYMRRYGSSESGWRFRLVLPRWVSSIEQVPHKQNTRLITFSAIDHWYRPDVIHRIYGRNDWYAARREMDPAQLLAWIGLQPSEIRGFAERLLSEASIIDPLGDWHKVIRQGRREWWGKLKSDALIANDQRVAAEILLLFYEDLVQHGVADPLPVPGVRRIHHPLDDRVGRRQSELDETLTHFGLSPSMGVRRPAAGREGLRNRSPDDMLGNQLQLPSMSRGCQ